MAIYNKGEKCHKCGHSFEFERPDEELTMGVIGGQEIFLSIHTPKEYEGQYPDKMNFCFACVIQVLRG